MTSLREQNEKMQQWLNESASWGSGDELRFDKGDHPRVIFYFATNGNDGDRFIKIYKSHIIDAVGKNGNKYTTHRYCPIASGEGGDCPNCAAGHTTIKPRFSMWMYVMDILHEIMPKDKSFPHVMVEGRPFFREEVNGFKIWHTSAWKDSPWGMITTLHDLYRGDMHKFVARLEVISDGLSRRYTVYSIPETAPMPQDIYVEAQELCTPIADLLKQQVVPVESNPASSQSTLGAPINTPAQPYVMPGSQAPAYVPSLGQRTADAPTEYAVGSEIQTVEEEDNRRPMRSMF